MKTTDIITIRRLYWSMRDKAFVPAKNKSSELNLSEAEYALDLIMASDQYKEFKLIRTISSTFRVK